MLVVRYSVFLMSLSILRCAWYFSRPGMSFWMSVSHGPASGTFSCSARRRKKFTSSLVTHQALVDVSIADWFSGQPGPSFSALGATRPKYAAVDPHRR